MSEEGKDYQSIKKMNNEKEGRGLWTGISTTTVTLLAGGFALIALISVIVIITLLSGPQDNQLRDANQRLMQRLADQRSVYARTVARVICSQAAEGGVEAQKLLEIMKLGELDRGDVLEAVDFHHCILVMNKIGSEDGRFSIKLFSFSQRRGREAPNRIEEAALEWLKENQSMQEYARLDQEDGLFRYFRPVFMGENCVACHGDPSLSVNYWDRNDGKDCSGTEMEGWVAGDCVGVIEVIQSLKQD